MAAQAERHADDISTLFKTIQSDYSANRSILVNDGVTTLRLSDCTADRRSLFGSLGSALIAIEGKHETLCQIHYVTEMEGSGWEWDNAITCAVPITTGSISLPVHSIYGIDTSPLKQYCAPMRNLGQIKKCLFITDSIDTLWCHSWMQKPASFPAYNQRIV